MATLMHRRKNGYLATVTGLKMDVADWKVWIVGVVGWPLLPSVPHGKEIRHSKTAVVVKWGEIARKWDALHTPSG